MNLYGAFECAFHIFAFMAQVLNFNIHACVVYASCRFKMMKWKTSMHRLSNQTHIHFMKTRPLLVMLISWGILVFVYVQLLMVLRMVYQCTPMVSCIKCPSLIPQHHLVGIVSYIYYLSICASFNPNSQHIYRGSNCYHMEFMKLVHILLHMVNMFGQATWIQLNFSSYL